MRKERGKIILTNKQAIELYLLLSNARIKLNGKNKTLASRYFREFEYLLDLSPNKTTSYNVQIAKEDKDE